MNVGEEVEGGLEVVVGELCQIVVAGKIKVGGVDVAVELFLARENGGLVAHETGERIAGVRIGLVLGRVGQHLVDQVELVGSGLDTANVLLHGFWLCFLFEGGDRWLRIRMPPLWYW